MANISISIICAEPAFSRIKSCLLDQYDRKKQTGGRRSPRFGWKKGAVPINSPFCCCFEYVAMLFSGIKDEGWCLSCLVCFSLSSLLLRSDQSGFWMIRSISIAGMLLNPLWCVSIFLLVKSFVLLPLKTVSWTCSCWFQAFQKISMIIVSNNNHIPKQKVRNP